MLMFFFVSKASEGIKKAVKGTPCRCPEATFFAAQSRQSEANGDLYQRFGRTHDQCEPGKSLAACKQVKKPQVRTKAEAQLHEKFHLTLTHIKTSLMAIDESLIFLPNTK